MKIFLCGERVEVFDDCENVVRALFWLCLAIVGRVPDGEHVVQLMSLHKVRVVDGAIHVGEKVRPDEPLGLAHCIFQEVHRRLGHDQIVEDCAYFDREPVKSLWTAVATIVLSGEVPADPYDLFHRAHEIDAHPAYPPITREMFESRHYLKSAWLRIREILDDAVRARK